MIIETFLNDKGFSVSQHAQVFQHIRGLGDLPTHVNSDIVEYWKEACCGNTQAQDSEPKSKGDSSILEEFENAPPIIKYRMVKDAMLNTSANCDVLNQEAYLSTLNAIMPVIVLSAANMEEVQSLLTKLEDDSFNLGPKYISNIVAICPALCSLAVELMVAQINNAGTMTGDESTTSDQQSNNSNNSSSSSTSQIPSPAGTALSSSPAILDTFTNSSSNIRKWRAMQVIIAIAAQSLSLARMVRGYLLPRSEMAAACIEITALFIRDMHTFFDQDVLPLSQKICSNQFFKNIPDVVLKCIFDCLLDTLSSSSRYDPNATENYQTITTCGRCLVVIFQLCADRMSAVCPLSLLSPVLSKLMSEDAVGPLPPAVEASWIHRLRVSTVILVARLIVNHGAGILKKTASTEHSVPATPLPYLKSASASGICAIQDEMPILLPILKRCLILLSPDSQYQQRSMQARVKKGGEVEQGEIFIDTMQPFCQLFVLHLSLAVQFSSRETLRELVLTEMEIKHLGDLLPLPPLAGGALAAKDTSLIRSIEGSLVRMERSPERLVAVLMGIPRPTHINAQHETAADFLHTLRLLLHFDIFRAAKTSAIAAHPPGQPPPPVDPTIPDAHVALTEVMIYVSQTASWPPHAALQRTLDLWMARCARGPGGSAIGGAATAAGTIGGGWSGGVGLLLPLMPELVKKLTEPLQCTLSPPNILRAATRTSSKYQDCFCWSSRTRGLTVLHIRELGEEWTKLCAADTSIFSLNSVCGGVLSSPCLCPCAIKELAAADTNVLMDKVWPGVIACYTALRYAVNTVDNQSLHMAPFICDFRSLPVKSAIQVLSALKFDPTTHAMLSSMLDCVRRLVPELLADARLLLPLHTQESLSIPSLVGTSSLSLQSHSVLEMQRILTGSLCSHILKRYSDVIATSDNAFVATAKVGQGGSSSFSDLTGNKRPREPASSNGSNLPSTVASIAPDESNKVVSTDLFAIFRQIHAACPTPQSLELWLINWLFTVEDLRVSSKRWDQRGAKKRGERSGIANLTCHFSSYSHLAQEPLCLMRLPIELLHIPLVLQLVSFLTQNLLLASRAAASEALRAKKSVVNALWRGQGAQAAMAPGKLGKSCWDVCLFIEDNTYAELQELILSRMLLQIWYRYSLPTEFQTNFPVDDLTRSLSSPDGDEYPVVRTTLMDLLDSLLSRAPGLVGLLLHYGLNDNDMALLCGKPRLCEALGKGLYRTIITLSGHCMTVPILQGILSHCMLFLKHSRNDTINKKLCIALPSFLLKSSGCLTPFHIPDDAESIHSVIKSIYFIMQKRFPTCALRLIDLALLSENAAKFRRDNEIYQDGDSLGAKRLRAMLLNLPLHSIRNASGNIDSGSAEKALNGDKKVDVVEVDRSHRSLLACHLLAKSGLLSLGTDETAKKRPKAKA